MTDPTVWDTVHDLAAWLDRNPGDTTGTDPRILRCLKVTEEVGEVAQAVIGAVGQNPRKGVTHTWNDVADELCDTALTALVALAALVPDPQGFFDRTWRRSPSGPAWAVRHEPFQWFPASRRHEDAATPAPGRSRRTTSRRTSTRRRTRGPARGRPGVRPDRRTGTCGTDRRPADPPCRRRHPVSAVTAGMRPRARTAADRAIQVLLPLLTLTGMALNATRHPAAALLFTAAAQPPWLLSSFRAWRHAGQVGMFLTSVAAAVISACGVANYWLIGGPR